MASSTPSTGTAGAAAKTAAAPKPAAAKTTQAKAAARARTTPAADKDTAAKADSTARKTTTANGAPNGTANAASKPTAKPRESKAAPGSKGSGHVVTVTIPITVDQLVSATVTVAKLPATVVRRVVKTGRDLPVYLGIGGLAVAGVAEWPVAAAAGVGYAALRRWGPLRRESAPAGAAAEKPKPGAAPAAEQVKIEDEAETAT